jgi:hypothetical protein
MAELSCPVDREGELSVQRLFCPQRAVIVEHRNTVRLRDEVRRVVIGNSGDEVHDRVLRGCLTPAWQAVVFH